MTMILAGIGSIFLPVALWQIVVVHKHQLLYEYRTGYYIPCVESFGLEIDKHSIPS